MQLLPSFLHELLDFSQIVKAPCSYESIFSLFLSLKETPFLDVGLDDTVASGVLGVGLGHILISDDISIDESGETSTVS